MTIAARSVLKRSLAMLLLGASLFAGFARGGALPACAIAEPATAGVDAAVERQPICIASTVASAGELGDVVYYRSARQADGSLSVGYYAFFSEERPWGNNWLTWMVLPAFAIDLVYTHGLFFGPGIQRIAYGKGDVEGFRVVYQVDDSGLSAQSGVADDGAHREVPLARSDLLSIDRERPTVYTRWWSHQLGGRGAGPSDLVYRRCYGPSSIRPLPADVAADFRLDRRAGPARTLAGLPATTSASAPARSAALRWARSFTDLLAAVGLHAPDA